MSPEEDLDKKESVVSNILVQFKNEAGEISSSPFDMPVNVTTQQLQVICNAVLRKEEPVPFLFFVDDVQIKDSLESTLKDKPSNTEKILDIVYAEQAVFRVRPVTRCTSSLSGHAEAVLSASFSPDGRYLASGSGDTLVRLWDVNTETPQYTCQGTKHWVLCVSWSPNGMKLASGYENGEISIWNPETGKEFVKPLLGHSKYITAVCWEPIHLNAECRRIASASKDATVRVWDIVTRKLLFVLSHCDCVTCVKWGGTGLIYSSSRDCTIKVWNASNGSIYQTLGGHGHWVNTIALSTDYLLRTGPYDPSKATCVYREITETAEELSDIALKRYNSITKGEPEMLVSGSDDHSMFLWTPMKKKNKHVERMTGHQSLINDVKFSPDMRIIASASFDKSIKIWNGRTGKFITTLRGHVQCVYQIAWSADSRLLVSGSADSTLKVWDLTTDKITDKIKPLDLPGHADEIYAVDWSPDGQRVVSGGKDKVIKIWRT
ncbi:notchless protein homolog 1-like [Uloborus diversus]|uniref:notchless protein homolog 1-like n=1 Tax=Uloborus diversus TaxID=327109 RepID=UPI002408FB5E|nr:notchless protein homolog 1-like [Uloborus diversus]